MTYKTYINVKFEESMHFYLCGLDAMIDEVSDWLEEYGVDFTNIHREVFFFNNET